MRKCKRSTIVGPFIHVCIIVCVQVELDPATQPGHSRGVSAFVTASKIQNPDIKPQGGCLVGSQWYCVVPTEQCCTLGQTQ